MIANKRKYALFALLLVVIIQFTNGYKLGSIGLRSLPREGEDAGKNSELKQNDNTLMKKIFSNKEYLFDDNEEQLNPKSIVTEDMPNKEMNFNDLVDTFDEDNMDHLSRTQRTNANDDLFNTYIELLENKLNDIDQENIIAEEDYSPYFNYDYLNKDLNAEDEMKTKEIQNFEDKIAELNYDDSDLESLLKQIQVEKNPEKKVLKPIVHFKETILSKDVYNKKLAEQDLKNAMFKQISESVTVTNYPDHAKVEKYHHREHLNNEKLQMDKQKDYLFISVIAGCTLAALLAVIVGGVCYYSMKNKNQRFDMKNGLFNTPAMTKSNSLKSNSSNSSGDRRLAQSAQMFHYQHQKQQMIAMEKANSETKQDHSDNSDAEAEEGDYTVYECPGLAPTGEMEVKNPLFKEDFPSTNNLAASSSVTSMPPAYSTVTDSSESKTKESAPEKTTKPTNLIEVNETSADANASINTTTTTINEEKQ